MRGPSRALRARPVICFTFEETKAPPTLGPLVVRDPTGTGPRVGLRGKLMLAALCLLPPEIAVERENRTGRRGLLPLSICGSRWRQNLGEQRESQFQVGLGL